MESVLPGLGSLMNKLAHPLLDTRLRSTKNLIFKFKNNLIADVLENSTLSKQLFQGISQSIRLSFEELSNDEMTPLLKHKVENQLQQLLDLVMQCTAHCTVFSHDYFSDIVEVLNSLPETVGVSKVICNRVQQVLQSIHIQRCRDVVDPSSNSEAIGVFEEGGDISSSTWGPVNRPLSQQIQQVLYTSASTTCNDTLFGEGGSHLMSAGCSGLGRPGCILFSELALRGWRFPPFLFTETDEKLLFDIEVKVKMGHQMAGRLAFDLLYDFPANAILQRVGLLESMLNLLASSTPVNGQYHSLQLDQNYSLRWFRVLVQRCASLFEQLLDGGLCSRPPPQLKHLQSSSLAAQMSHEMYAMRDPLHIGKKQLQGGNVDKDKEESCIFSCPSLSGIAFAAVAAALPLLARSDVEINSNVLELLQESLPFVCDALEGMEGTKKNSIPPTACNFNRLQHLLNRMEQILHNAYKDSLLCLPSPPDPPTYPCEDNNGLGEESVAFVLSLDLCSVLVRLLTLIVDDSGFELQQQRSPPLSGASPDDLEPPSNSVLLLGVSVVKIIKQMYSVPHYEGIFPRSLLLTILKGVDSSFLQSIALQDHAHSCCMRLLSHHAWVDCEAGGLHEVFGYLSDIFHYVATSATAENPDMAATVKVTTNIGGSDTLQVINVLVAALPVAQSMVAQAFSSSKETTKEGELVEKFDHLLQDVLSLCSSENKDVLATAVDASIMFFLGTKGGSKLSENDREISALQEYLLLPLRENPSVVFGELQHILLLRISTFSFLCPYLSNVIFPRIAENTLSGNMSVTEENSSLSLLCLILEQLQLKFRHSDHGCVHKNDENHFFLFVVFHIQLLLWKLFDDAVTTCRLRTSMESLLSTLKNHQSGRDLCFSRVYVAGLFSSKEQVRRWCFHELCVSKLVQGTRTDLSPQFHIGINEAYCENNLLSSLDDLSTTTATTINKKKSVATSHSKRNLSSHADLHSLLAIAFGDKSEDATIRYSAVKQLTATVVKDSTLLVTMDMAVCINLSTNLYDIISENYLLFLRGEDERNHEKEHFVAQCALLLRCVLLTVPALLNNIDADISPPLCESDESSEGERRHLFMANMMHFVLLSHMAGWGSDQSQNRSLTTFTVCCHDILRLWAMYPIDCQWGKFRYAHPSLSCTAATLTLPACYATEFCTVNLSALPADVSEKYLNPLVFDFSQYPMLPPENCCVHDTEGQAFISNEDDDHEVNDVTAVCAGLEKYSEILAAGLTKARKNSTFNEILQLCHNMTLSAPLSRFVEPIMNSSIVSSAMKIIQGFPSTEQDFLTLNLTLSVLRALVSGFNAQQQASICTEACQLEMLNMIDIIISSFGGVLRYFFTSEREYEKKPCTAAASTSVVIFQDCQHNILLLLSDALVMLTETCMREKSSGKVSAGNVSCRADKELSHFFPLLLEAFIGGTTFSRPQIQYASSMCLQAMARYCSLSETSHFSPQLITCLNEGDRRGRSQFDLLVANVKQLRNPNSMRESCAVISALRCLIVFLKLDSATILARKCWNSLGGECLLRYTRDRRAIIRHMALELLCLFQQGGRGFSRSVLREDNVDADADENKDCGNNSTGVGAGIVTDADEMEKCLHIIAADDSEASSIRCLSLRVLVLQDASKKSIVTEGDELVRFVLPVVSELLGDSCCQPSGAIVISCLKILQTFMRSDVNTRSTANISELISMLKIIPKIVAILQPGYLMSLLKDVKSRTYALCLESCNQNFEFSCGGWKRSELKYLNYQKRFFSTTRSLCLVTLAELCFVDSRILQPCLRNTNIVRNIICALTDPSYIKLFSMSNCEKFTKKIKLFRSMSCAISSCADLLSLVLIRDQLKTFEDGRENDAFGCIHDLIRDPVVISASIISSMTTYFHFVASLEIDVLTRDVFDGLMLSLLRLLMLLINIPAWRAGIGLLEAEVEKISAPDKYFAFGLDLFVSLVAAHAAYVSSPNTDPVMINAMYSAMSCMLQYSSRLRDHFQSEILPLVESYGGHGLKVQPVAGEGHSLPITHSMGTVVRHTLGVIFMDAGVEDKILRLKMLPSEKTTEKAGNSSFKLEHTKKSLKQSSQYCRRDKVRGYQFIKQHKSLQQNDGSSGDVSLSQRTLRLQQWSALLFFVGAFKQSKNQEVLNSIGFPNALIRLLRGDSGTTCYSEARHDQSKKKCLTSEHLQHHIKALALSALATFVSGSSSRKHACLASPAARASEHIALLCKEKSKNDDESDSRGRSMLPCRLLTLGLRPEEDLVNRLLALRLLEAFARDNLHTATLRTTIHNNIVFALRNDLKAATQASCDCLPPEVFSGLLDALGSVLLLPVDPHSTLGSPTTAAATVRAHSMGPRTEQSSVIARYQSTAPSTKSVLPIPELVRWTYERYHRCSTISLSLMRFIGRISCENSFVRNGRWTIPCRKTFAVVLSEEVLDTVMSSCSARQDTAVRSLALSALWFILHTSERARSYFKNKKYPEGDRFGFAEGGQWNNDEHIRYAEKMVYSLIQND